MLLFCYIIPVSFVLFYIDAIRQVDWNPGPIQMSKLCKWAASGDMKGLEKLHGH